MAQYTKLPYSFWSGKTLRKLKGQHLAQSMAVFMISNQQMNMIGVYELPIPVISHYLGCTIEGASKGLESLIEAGFCLYDYELDMVWVVDCLEMTVGKTSRNDKQIICIKKLFDEIPECSIKSVFYSVYGDQYYIENYTPTENLSKPLGSPLEAPSKHIDIDVNIDVDVDVNIKKEKKEKPQTASATRSIVSKPDDVSDQTWADWVAHRKAKKATVTETVLKSIQAEADKAGMNLEAALETMCARGWSGFKAEWVQPAVQANTKSQIIGKSTGSAADDIVGQIFGDVLDGDCFFVKDTLEIEKNGDA